MTFTLCVITSSSFLILNVSSPIDVEKEASKIDCPKLPKTLLKFPSFNSLILPMISNTSFGTKDSNSLEVDKSKILISSVCSNWIFSTVDTNTNSGIIKINIVTKPLNAPIKEPMSLSSKVTCLLGLIRTFLSTSMSFFMTFIILYLGYKRFSMS